MRIGIEYKNMPRGFKTWFLKQRSKVRLLSFKDVEAVGFEISSLEDEVYKEMLSKFPQIAHTVIDENRKTAEEINYQL